MGIITKLKKDKPLFPRKLDNSILDKLVKFIDTGTKNINYMWATFSKVETEVPEERGEVTSLICNSAFKANHTRIGWQDVDTIEAKFLPDNLAIGIYQNDKMDYDITVLGYINRKKKWIKLKFITDYAIICFEED